MNIIKWSKTNRFMFWWRWWRWRWLWFSVVFRFRRWWWFRCMFWLWWWRWLWCMLRLRRWWRFWCMLRWGWWRLWIFRTFMLIWFVTPCIIVIFFLSWWCIFGWHRCWHIYWFGRNRFEFDRISSSITLTYLTGSKCNRLNKNVKIKTQNINTQHKIRVNKSLRIFSLNFFVLNLKLITFDFFSLTISTVFAWIVKNASTTKINSVLMMSDSLHVLKPNYKRNYRLSVLVLLLFTSRHSRN